MRRTENSSRPAPPAAAPQTGLCPAAAILLAVMASGCVKKRPPEGPRPPVPAPPAGGAHDTDAARAASVETFPITEPVATFVLDGQPYCFSGTNNYYLTFQSRPMVDDVLDRAVTLNMDVLRIWAFIDIGSLDGAVPHVDDVAEEKGTKNGVYFQYFDTETGQVRVNEGPDGLERLDYVLHACRERGLKVILVLTNNWRDMGGVDQYVAWYGARHHHEFFTDDRIRARFKAWIHTLVHRTNTVDGRVYRDDPAIFAWELGNELRCRNLGPFDSPTGWDDTTIVTWADEMSRYIKEQDPNHMVGMGDEGFLNGAGDHWTHSPVDGVDHQALSALEAIDFATFHLYPDNWEIDVGFGADWIRDHLAVARDIGKPVILEEYNTKVIRDKDRAITWGWERRKQALEAWHDIMREEGGSGTLIWMMAGIDDVHGLYPDYDGYNFWDGHPTAELLQAHGARFKREARACLLARELAAEVPKGPFVSAVRLRK